MKLKKIIYLALALTTISAALAMYGCGKDNSSSGSGGTSFFPTVNL